ncbi:MAG TPA: hypothetical protein VGD35_23750 [Chitinophaga sp.]
MALQVGICKFTGRLDNVIGYRRNGKYFLRSMPDKVRQTAATKRAARHFGMASRKGKLIRKAFRPHLDMRYDGTLVNRLNKLFIQAGRDNFPNLQGFHFNRHTGLEKLFIEPPVFTVNGTLHIPAQELLPQGNNTHVELRLIATRISFTANRVISTDVSTAIIKLNEDERFNGIALNVPIEGEGVLMVALQYRSCKECNGLLYPSGDRRYMAADIIHMIVPLAETATPIITRKRFAFRKLANGSSSPSFRGANGSPSPSFRGANGSPSTSLRGPRSPV